MLYFGDAVSSCPREDFNPVRVLAFCICTCKQKEGCPRTIYLKDFRAEVSANTSLDSCLEKCAADHPLTDGFSGTASASSVMCLAMNGAFANAKTMVRPISPKTLKETHWSVV